ncbi:MAG TPA: metallophosphoesterase [Planctomycetaceae bacterium]|nr:metallophosphoesterase [Planctomycetaceae bacterium]
MTHHVARYCTAVVNLILFASFAVRPSAIVFAQETKVGQASGQKLSSPQLQVARGCVYRDENGNSIRDPGEAGIPGVRVSNGQDIVTTDASGRYELNVDDDAIVFVIKPRNFRTPVSSQQLPRFFYIHKPGGSPANYKYPGVAPTGPLPESIDFGLIPQSEPDQFRALIFGDTQPRNVEEVEYMAHDVIEQIIAERAHDAALGITLGDIVFDDLSVMEPHNQAVALIGIPWYNVLGNHDMNYDATDDRHSDETFERIYGPSYYSFDYGPTHFLVVDDVTWLAAANGEPAHYVGGLGPKQLRFIKNDLAGIPQDQLVVLLMHIPLTDVRDRQELYRLIEQRPAAISLSAHTHYMEHRFIGSEDGWQGPRPHHHIVNVTVCGSWWGGRKDERGIPHATMSDGGPNGYSILSFDGSRYDLQFRAAGRPDDYQMNVYAPESVSTDRLSSTPVRVNVFAGCANTRCQMRVGSTGQWIDMQRLAQPDPAFVNEKARDKAILLKNWRELPETYSTPHIWQANLPEAIAAGTHTIEIRVIWPSKRESSSTRVVRVAPAASGS